MSHTNESPLPETFWTSPEVVRLLRNCDIPGIIAAVRQARGWSQARLGEALGYSQAWVSKVVRASQPVTLEQAKEILQRLEVPVHLVRLGEQDAGGDDPTKRRDLLQSAALAGLTLPVSNTSRVDVDDATPAALRAVTGAQRRLDAAMPSHELAEPVEAHFRLTHQLVDKAGSELRANLDEVASEAAGFAAWLHFDMQDLGSANRYYRRAIAHALHAGHRLLTGYMVGSLAAFEIENNDPARGLALTYQAGEHFGDAPPPAAAAWLSSIQALGYATDGVAAEADRCLSIAKAAALRAQRNAAPWPWVFPFDFSKVAGYRALCAVRLGRPVEALAIFNDLDNPQSPKQEALIKLERAHAHLRLNQPDECFQLARQAFATGTRTQSERVTRRARRLRRCYTGTPTAVVRAFDTQLRQAAV